jgi:hypothetical protein
MPASEIMAIFRQQAAAMQRLVSLSDARMAAGSKDVASPEMPGGGWQVDRATSLEVLCDSQTAGSPDPHGTLQIFGDEGVPRPSTADRHLPGSADSPVRTGVIRAATAESIETIEQAHERPASAIDHHWDRQLAKRPMEVECNVIILNLEGVDTANHTFSANIVAEFRVLYPGDVHTWDPKIRCTNLKESTMEPVASQYNALTAVTSSSGSGMEFLLSTWSCAISQWTSRTWHWSLWQIGRRTKSD